MEALSLYPHYLYIKKVGEPHTDELGDWVEGESEWVYIGRCREEGNGSGATISTYDIKEYKFSSTIYMPTTIPHIEYGTTVFVSAEKAQRTDMSQEELLDGVRNGSIRAYGDCAKFDKTRLHSRMWL